MKSRMILCMVLAGLAAAGAWAQTKEKKAGRRAAQVLRQADANKDGRVTFEELKAVRPQITEERFKAADKNGDGVLSREDRTAAAGSGTEPAGVFARLKQADTNGDRKLSREEAQAAFPRMAERFFDKADRDGDGFVTLEEAKQVLGEKLRQADTDGDGKLTQDEAKAAFPRMNGQIFQRLDRNKDGFLSKEDSNR